MTTTPPTDRSPFGIQPGAFDDLTRRMVRSVAHYREQSRSDLNQSPPALTIRNGKRVFETLPVPLRRLFGSPVVMSGRYARGPENERVIASGWNDARSTAYDSAANSATRHNGLDFTTDYGETIYACADGIVTFVGFQHRARQGVQVDGAHQDADGNVRNRAGDVVGVGSGSPNAIDVGFGGIIVFVVHNGDFQNYRTEYMHLSDTLVHVGDHVSEGQPIAKAGGSGGYYGHFVKGIHLHFQAAFRAGSWAIVRPSFLVPNFWPPSFRPPAKDGIAHEDSTTGTEGRSPPNLPGSSPVGLGAIAGNSANQLQSIDRATDAENQRAGDYKGMQAAHSEHVANTLIAQQSALYDAIGKFQSGGLEVQNAMTFDFSTGTWAPDGKAV